MKYLVYDIGGCFVKYGLIQANDVITSSDEIIDKGKFETPADDKEMFINEIKSIYNKYKDSVVGIAISMPGKIDVFNGYAHSAGVLDYLERINIVDLFHEFTDLPVAVENDGKCAALAESWFGSLKDVESGMALVFGTGVGGGLVFNNRLYRGFNSIAGEFSFVYNQNGSGEPNYLGVDGSVSSLVRIVEKEMDLVKGTLDGEKVFAMINEKDPIGEAALIKYCDGIVPHLMNFQHIIDPEKISIGGGISEQKVFIDCLKERIEHLIISNVPYYLAKPTIVQSKFRNDANLMGALANFHLNKIKKIDKRVEVIAGNEMNKE